jgi:hypothetical protein
MTTDADARLTELQEGYGRLAAKSISDGARLAAVAALVKGWSHSANCPNVGVESRSGTTNPSYCRRCAIESLIGGDLSQPTPSARTLKWKPYVFDDDDTRVDSLIETAIERPKIVCLCGSGRFMDQFNEAEFQETLAGHIVLTIGCNTKDIARSASLSHHKPMLDELHKRKIDLADEVYVLNIGGYIGESTRSEIDYAIAHSKPVRYMEQHP